MGAILANVEEEGALHRWLPRGARTVRMVLETDRCRDRTEEDTSMEERGHIETVGDYPSMTPSDLVDLDRLGSFRYGIITRVDKDGFPFSISTDFVLSENGEILLKKPNVSPAVGSS